MRTSKPINEIPNKVIANNNHIAPQFICEDLFDNINRIKEEIGNPSDFVTRFFTMGQDHSKYAILYLKGLIDKRILDTLSSELIDLYFLKNDYDETNEEEFFSFENIVLCGRKVTQGKSYEVFFEKLLIGHLMILKAGSNKFVAIDAYNPQGRAVDQPTSQTIVRGPKDAFTEKLDVNLSLIRARIKSKALRIENMILGNITKTTIAIIYIEKIADEEILLEIKKRLKRIDIDGILDGGYIEQLIKDDPYSVFPTIINSEKPDATVGKLLEGKIVILVEGTPYVLTAPVVIWECFQVSEDYYHHFVIAAMFRIIRYIAGFLTLLVPSAYIAISTFHQEMIPPELLIGIAAQREGVPFPVFIEALLMEATFEILREAGVRMPKAIGSAISIVGALVLGQAAVEAGMISAGMVIIVSITAISSMAIADYSLSNAVRILRFIFMILSATFGLFGIFMGLIVLVLHLCKLKSIGIPYLTPIAPMVSGENKDSIIRAPLWQMKYRPSFYSKSTSPRIDMEVPVNDQQKNDQELR